MPLKKAAQAPAKSTKPVNSTLMASKSKVTKAAEKTTSKATAQEEKALAPESKATKITKKRKAEYEVEEPVLNGNVKRPRAKKESTPVVKPAKRAALEEPAELPAPQPLVKSPAVKKPGRSKAKVAINHPPTERLNVYVFGVGEAGELGLGNAKGQTEVKRPRLNILLAADKVGVVQVAVGGMHTAVLTHDNKILTWGVNDQGALGRDTAWDGGLIDIDNDKESDDDSESGEGVINPLESTPAEMDVSSLPEGTIFTQLACTDSATFAVTEEGLVYGCGTFRVSFSDASHLYTPNLALVKRRNLWLLFLGPHRTSTRPRGWTKEDYKNIRRREPRPSAGK